ncbi:hypothetical protein NEOLEDRAFT_1130289 [Neolentinus lepideus HHB14362 ss-1]|uniref:RRM Nup35-type domain-containing protein n=1 Tax=Neolentinus lepideus HHB14362 ss-1 TaxID=1314782 RepID=A0A165U8Q0_9AGAM|nr:hypothetical protein NEOLEDRAFT_1130289 [Neolentinus lepideus HHB14362 ss-1]
MYSSSYGHSSSRSTDYGQERPKSTFTYSSHNSPFTASARAQDTPNFPGPTWANLGRVPYQTGYLLCAPPPEIQAATQAREYDYPVIPTQAKLSHILQRDYDPNSIADSMFKSNKDKKYPDEEGPPMQSVLDIPNEGPDPKTARMNFERRFVDPPSTPKQRPSTRASTSPLYIIVFGYPPDCYSASVEYFKALGETTEPEQNAEIMNCFKIGYKNPPEALRAIRKNGEVIAGSWMIGVKWADPVIAESLLGAGGVRSMNMFQTPDPRHKGSPDKDPSSSPHGIDLSRPIGTPLKLAPSTSAFKKGHGVSGSLGGLPSAIPTQDSPNKGLIGQVSDFIFGW